MKSIKLAQEIYLFRKSQIHTAWDKVLTRADKLELSLQIRNVHEADIAFQGYVNKHKILLARIAELDEDYSNIIYSMLHNSIWNKYFSWLPFLKTNKTTERLALEFIKKWDTYQPGW